MVGQKMELTFIPIAAILILSIKLAGQPQRKSQAGILLGLSVAAFLINEIALRQFHPEYNIRVDLIILIPLVLVAASRIIFPHADKNSQSSASRLAASCLTLSLVNLVAWMLPILASVAVLKGHKALKEGVSGSDRIKVFFGLFLGYGQIMAAAYLWLSIFE